MHGRGPARVPPLHVCHHPSAHQRDTSRAGGAAQKEPKAFLAPEPAGTTRSTLKRTVLDSGLRSGQGAGGGV